MTEKDYIIYVIDWLVNKPIKIRKKQKKTINLNYGDKVLYTGGKSSEKFVGIYLGYECTTSKEGTFVEKMGEETERKFWEVNEQNHNKYFPVFKEKFKKFSSEVIPITSRTNFSGDTIYFYFFSPERLDFTEFLPEMRQHVKKNFFLFQIGARDRIRMDPRTDNLLGPCGYKLCCKNGDCPLPSVESNNVFLQNLKYIESERLKGRCNKLKCCLNYEKGIYEKEKKFFPEKGEEITFNEKTYTCFSFNIMTGEIMAKNEYENITVHLKYPLQTIKNKKMKKKTLNL